MHTSYLRYFMGQRGLSQTLSGSSHSTRQELHNSACLALTRWGPHTSQHNSSRMSHQQIVLYQEKSGRSGKTPKTTPLPTSSFGPAWPDGLRSKGKGGGALCGLGLAKLEGADGRRCTCRGDEGSVCS